MDKTPARPWIRCGIEGIETNDGLVVSHMEKVEMRTVFATAMVLGTFAGPVNATDLCRALALRDTSAVESPTTVLAKGAHLEDVTSYEVGRKDGAKTFCEHGGYCYYASLTVGGHDIPVLKLENCKIGKEDGSDEDRQSYDVDVVRTAVPKVALRREDVENQFLKMGLCSACADNVSQFYVKKPNSQCAVLAKSALEGNPDAVRELSAGPVFCEWHY